SLAPVLGGLGLRPDFEYSAEAGSQLAFIHRREGEADIYFVSNQRTHYDRVECRFRVDGRAPEFWHPETGLIEPAPVWRQEDGRTVVPLSFDPAGSLFVVFRAQASGDHLVEIRREGPLAADRPKPAGLRILKAVYGAFPGHGETWADVTAAVK